MAVMFYDQLTSVLYEFVDQIYSFTLGHISKHVTVNYYMSVIPHSVILSVH